MHLVLPDSHIVPDVHRADSASTVVRFLRPASSGGDGGVPWSVALRHASQAAVSLMKQVPALRLACSWTCNQTCTGVPSPETRNAVLLVRGVYAAWRLQLLKLRICCVL